MGSRAASALLRLEAARLGYRPAATKAVDLSIMPAACGGHALLGANGAGKTLVAEAVVQRGGALLHGGRLVCRDGWSHRSVSRVSFDAHQQLLADGGSVYRAIGHLGAAARFLVVRFGLHPLLYRPVRAISTGEIRKVLLVRALASAPELLVLDNAFDGLDVPSRQHLSELLSQMLRGFGQLLVQGIDASATAHTQVLLLTHRAEEIVDEISSVSTMSATGGLRTAPRQGRPSHQLMADALGDGAGEAAAIAPPPHLMSVPGWLPPAVSGVTVVEATGLRLERGTAMLLSGLDWRVRSGEHWLVAGGNGAGKSTLSRLLANGLPDGRRLRDGGVGATPSAAVAANEAPRSDRNGSVRGGGGVGATPSAAVAADEAARADRNGSACGGGGVGAAPSAAVAADEAAHSELDGSLCVLGHSITSSTDAAGLRAAGGVGWVSTELHLSVHRSAALVSAMLHERAASAATAAQVAECLGIGSLMHSRFCDLSQGEQKLVLIGAAVASEPSLLVVDEPCQGLDVHNRRAVLGLLQHVGARGGTCIVYITHHPEEMLPCITHVLHMQGGAATFQGTVSEYHEWHKPAQVQSAPLGQQGNAR